MYVKCAVGPNLFRTSWTCRLGFDEIKSASELCTAAAQGKVDLITHYIKGGINVDAADYDKRTALHIAAADGCLEAVSAPLRSMTTHTTLPPLHPDPKSSRLAMLTWQQALLPPSDSFSQLVNCSLLCTLLTGLCTQSEVSDFKVLYWRALASGWQALLFMHRQERK